MGLILLYFYNFAARREVTGLIRDLSRFEVKYLGWGVKKGKLKVKFWCFVAVSSFIWFSDYFFNKMAMPGMNIYIFFGYRFPSFCNYFYGFLYSEVLIFTENNFTEINSKLSALCRCDFDTKYVIYLVESHNELLDLSRKENRYFSVPFIVHVCQTFFFFVLLYSGLADDIIYGTLFDLIGIFKLFIYVICVCTYLGPCVVILKCWVQITHEVSRIFTL